MIFVGSRPFYDHRALPAQCRSVSHLRLLVTLSHDLRCNALLSNNISTLRLSVELAGPVMPLVTVLLLTLAPALVPCAAAPKRAPDEKAARELFLDLRGTGRLHELWLDTVASTPTTGQAANHAYESLYHSAGRPSWT